MTKHKSCKLVECCNALLLTEILQTRMAPTGEDSGVARNFLQGVRQSVAFFLLHPCSPALRAGLTIRGGAHTNVRRGPFLIRVHRIFSLRVHFSSPKMLTTLFSRQRTSTQRGKNCQFIAPPPGGGRDLPCYNRHDG